MESESAGGNPYHAKIGQKKKITYERANERDQNGSDPRIEMSTTIKRARNLHGCQVAGTDVGLDLIVFGQVMQKEDRDGNKEGKERVEFSMERFSGDWAEFLANERARQRTKRVWED